MGLSWRQRRPSARAQEDAQLRRPGSGRSIVGVHLLDRKSGQLDSNQGQCVWKRVSALMKEVGVERMSQTKAGSDDASDSQGGLAEHAWIWRPERLIFGAVQAGRSGPIAPDIVKTLDGVFAIWP